MDKDFYITFEEVCASICGIILPINEVRLEDNGDISVLHIVDDVDPPIKTVDGEMVREIGFFFSTEDLKPSEIN
jgi:hypothetical protein